MAAQKVLIVEDDVFLVKAYQVKLEKSGLEVSIVNDGDEAIAKLKESVPDVILLDLVMPRKDGFALLEEIKQHDEWKNIPVLVASNLGQQEDIDRAKSMGIEDYIVKTDLSLDELVERIHGLLKKNG